MTGEREGAALPAAQGESSAAREWRALGQLTLARVRLFVREPEAMFWVLVFPLALTMVLGWAFQNRKPADEVIAVVPASAEVLAEDASGIAQRAYEDEAAARLALQRGAVSAVLLPGTPPVLAFDPERPEAELARLRMLHLLAQEESPPALVFEEVTGTGIRYIDWLFPGILGMNLMSTGIWSIGFAIADTRQKKLLRRLMVTPMRRWHFLAAYILGRGIFLIGELACLLAFAYFVLRIPVNTSLVSFFAACLLGMSTFAAIGLLIAARPRTTEGVSGLMNAVMLPMWLFSGVFFSYERFPEFTHDVLRLLPLTAIVETLRGLMLDGESVLALAGPIAVQLGWIALAFTLALRWFRWE
ncbi:MAG: ABC transporter permease [Pseudomonadota bacterium]